MTDGHPDWNIDLQSGESRVDTPAGPTTPSHPAASEPSGLTGAPPIAPPPTAAPEQDERFIPKYRFDEVNSRASQVQQENQELREILKQLASRQPAAPPADAPVPYQTEEEAAYARQTEEIRQEFFRRFPEFQTQATTLARIEAQLAALAPVADVVPQMQARENQYWGTVASNTLRTLHQTVSTALLNGQPLDPASERGLHVSQKFFQWTSSQPDRVARYEANDPSLLQEFVTYFGDTYVTPWRGPSAPAANPAQAIAARVAKLPNAGPSQIPAPTVPGRDYTNEDDVHAHAWSVVKNLQQSVGR